MNDAVARVMCAIETVPSLARSPAVVAASAAKASGNCALMEAAMPRPMRHWQLQPWMMTSKSPRSARASRSPLMIFMARSCQVGLLPASFDLSGQIFVDRFIPQRGADLHEGDPQANCGQ